MRIPRARVLRAVTLFALWAVAVTGATLVGLTAVGAIGNGMVTPGPAPLTPPEVDARLAAAQAPDPGSPTTAAPSVDIPPGHVLAIGPGGTVVAFCSGGIPRLLAASPAQGFQETDKSDEDGLKVEFQSELLEVKARMTCAGEQPVADVSVKEDD